MLERAHHITGVGTALVDLKVINPTQTLPQTQQEVPEFLCHHNDVQKSVGGSMANSMATLARLMPGGSVTFLQRVGLDTHGVFYKQHTPKELISGIQIDAVNPTGVCIFAVTKGGQRMDQWPEVTFYGASDELEIPKGIGTSGDVFITNVNAYRRLAPKEQIVYALQEAANGDGIFVFRLSGIQHGTDEKFDKKELDVLLTSLPKPPDILFANAVELQHASGIEGVYSATLQAFPETKLLAITNGAKGSLVRFKDSVFELEPEQLSQNDVVDTTGAGDSYMGAMLAALFTRPYSKWTLEFIVSCAKIGTYASSLVIQSLESRLTEQQLKTIHEKILLMGVEYGIEETLVTREKELQNPNVYRETV